MADLTLTWLGHATFRFDTPGGKRIYVDPFLNGNPKCPENEQSLSASTSSRSRTGTWITSAMPRRCTRRSAATCSRRSSWRTGCA